MSLLPSRFAINDQLTPLGKLVEKVEPVEVDPVEAFNKGDHSIEPKWIGFDMAVSGSDETVRAEYSVTGSIVTIKGVAQTSSAEKVGDSRPLPVATPPKSRVDEFCERHAPPKREPVMWSYRFCGFSFLYRKSDLGWEVKLPKESDWAASGNGPAFFKSLVSGDLEGVTPIYADEASK